MNMNKETGKIWSREKVNSNLATHFSHANIWTLPKTWSKMQCFLVAEL